MALLLQVIKSWQVIAVTIAIILYLTLVSYVARAYHRPRASKTKAKKKKAVPIPVGPEEAEADGSDGSDELGLEEG